MMQQDPNMMAQMQMQQQQDMDGQQYYKVSVQQQVPFMAT
jgi:hypothetical protein